MSDLTRCAFCDSSRLEPGYQRDLRRLLRCGDCGAYTVVNPPRVDAWQQYEEGYFSELIEESLGLEPDFAKWDEFAGYVKGRDILEIGPGTGHFLAAGNAKGFNVSGVELSPAHRAYIREHWKIETRAELSAVAAESIDVAFSFNCIEHISELSGHMRDIYRVLRPEGRFVVSTCNGISLSARLARKWWPMFGTSDHMSIATPQALRRLGNRSGFTVDRVWTTEYPLETPMSLAIALRDARRNAAATFDQTVPELPVATSRGRLARSARALAQHWIFSPIGGTLSLLNLAGSVKAIFSKPKQAT
jgi:SAM-dependent methyltransferase